MTTFRIVVAACFVGSLLELGAFTPLPYLLIGSGLIMLISLLSLNLPVGKPVKARRH